MSAGKPAAGPSDTGLAGERTSLAWTRLALTLLGIPAAMLAYSAGSNWVAFATAGVSLALGLALLVVSLRRQRVAPGVIAAGVLAPAVPLILLTGGCVLALAISGGILVLE